MVNSESQKRDKARMLELRMKMKLTAEEALELRRLSARTRKRVSRERMRQVVTKSEQTGVPREHREKLYAIYDKDVDQATERMRVEYPSEVMAQLIANPRFLQTLDYETVHRYLRRKYYGTVMSRLGNTVYWRGDGFGVGGGRGKQRMEQAIEGMLRDVRVIRLPKQRDGSEDQSSSPPDDNRYTRFLDQPVAVDWGTESFPTRRQQTCCEQIVRFWRQFETLVLKTVAARGYPADTSARILSDEDVRSMPFDTKWERMWLNNWKVMRYSDYFWLKNILYLSAKERRDDGGSSTSEAGASAATTDELVVSRSTLYSTLKLLRTRLRGRTYRGRNLRGRPSPRWLERVAEDEKLDVAMSDPVACVLSLDESGRDGTVHMVPIKRPTPEPSLGATEPGTSAASSTTSTDDGVDRSLLEGPPLPHTTLVSYSPLQVRSAIDPVLEAMSQRSIGSCDDSMPFSVSSNGSPITSTPDDSRGCGDDDNDADYAPLPSFLGRLTTTRPAAAAATISAATSAFLAAQTTERVRRADAESITDAPIVSDDIPFPAYR